MQQKEPVIWCNSIYCSNKNLVSQVCVNQHCKINAFICSDKNCKCQKQKHQSCKKLQITKIITEIQDQKRKPTEEQLKSINKIIEYYDNIIQKFSQLKVQFVESSEKLGIRKYSQQFVKLLNDGNYGSIDGHFMSKIKFQIQRKNQIGEFNIFDPYQIKILWKDHERKILQLSQSLKKFEIVDNTRLFKKIDSKILQNRHKRNLLYFLPKQVESIQLLYRASDNNFKSNIFHSRCDEQTDTILIVETEFKNIIGGFVPFKWSSCKNQNNNQQGYPFLFSLSRQQKYELKQKTHKGVIYNSQNGPIFGSYNGMDLCLSNSKSASSDFPASYGHQYLQVTNKQLIGQKNKKHFQIHEYEVFKIIWKCQTI